MARLWSAGFEHAIAADPTGFAAFGTLPVQSTSTKRTGVGSLELTSLSSGASKAGRHRFRTSAGLGPYWLRFYLYVATRPTAANAVAAFGDGSGNSFAPLVTIRLNADGSLALYNGGTQVGSDSSVLSLTTWYRVELHVSLGAAAGGGDDVLTARVDGVDFATSSSQSVTAGPQSILLGGNIVPDAQTQGNWFFDDVGLNDNADAVDNSWPGEESLVHLTVTGDGDTTNRGTQGTDWDTAPTTGQNAGQQLDEGLDSDEATSAVRLLINSSGATNRVHYYAMSDPTTAGIGASDTIKFVAWLGFVTNNNGGSTSSYEPRSRIAGGATASGSAVNLTTLTYVLNQADQVTPPWKKHVAYMDPDTNTWTRTTLEGLEMGLRATDATPDVDISNLHAMVAFVPAAGGGGNRRRRVLMAV